jgi:hypothetical protein
MALIPQSLIDQAKSKIKSTFSGIPVKIPSINLLNASDVAKQTYSKLLPQVKENALQASYKIAQSPVLNKIAQGVERVRVMPAREFFLPTSQAFLPLRKCKALSYIKASANVQLD